MMAVHASFRRSPFARASNQRFSAPPTRQQQGAIAILFAVLLVVMLGMLALAIDLSRLFNRKVELQGAADVAALAAADQLIGTESSFDKASLAAAAAIAKFNYAYGSATVSWSAMTIKFAESPSGPWVDTAAAKTSPGAMHFAKVETAQQAELGVIKAYFLQAISSSVPTIGTDASAIAGRSTINVTPLAVCAMSGTPAEARGTAKELVQYGFRRGVGYDLMRLNPNGKTAANFLVNPIDPGSRAGSAANTAIGVVGPFVCSGTMPGAHAFEGQIRVSSPFPLASLHEQLNSRFDQFGAGKCKYQSAPPDTNVRAFDATVYNASGGWMKAPKSALQTAKESNEPAILRTVADTDPGSGDARDYGLLWAFAKPVPFSAYVAGVDEPSEGYTPFPISDWKTLYLPAAPEPDAYPLTSGGSVSTPYENRINYFSAPATIRGKGTPRRRVLNIPLLACPVAAGSDVPATVLAIGRFLMTMPATASSLPAEFGGIAPAATLGGAVELYK